MENEIWYTLISFFIINTKYSMYNKTNNQMEIKNSLNGSTSLKIGNKTYNIIDKDSLKQSEDGYYRYIYYIFDHKTGKYYIGQHRTISLELDDYCGSGSKILNEYESAKKELGKDWENRFTKCIIANALSEEELNFMEERIISKYVLSDMNSYNSIKGRKTGYKASNSIGVYVYDLNGKFIERFNSINKAALWATANANVRGKVSNCVSRIAKVIKDGKYKAFGLYFVDYEINDWETFVDSLINAKSKSKQCKNTPVVLIDCEDRTRKTFRNRNEAATWIIENGFSSTKSIKQVLKVVNDAIHQNRCAYGFMVKYMRLHNANDVKMGASIFKSNSQIASLVNMVNRYNSVFDFGTEKFTIELDERRFAMLLSSVTLFDLQNNRKTEISENGSEFSFMNVRFRKTTGNPRIVIENCIDGRCGEIDVPEDTEEELVELCRTVSLLDGVTVLGSSSGRTSDDRKVPNGRFWILIKCSSGKSLKRLVESFAVYDERRGKNLESSTNFEIVNQKSLDFEMKDEDCRDRCRLQMDEFAYRITNSSVDSMSRMERMKSYGEMSSLIMDGNC